MKKQDRSLYTAQDWKNNFILRKRKYYLDFPRGKSSDIKHEMIELDGKIGHKIVMSIQGLFIYRYEPTYLVYQAIYDIEGIGYVSAKGGNGMYQLFVEDFSVDRSIAFWVSVYICFLRG